MVLTQAQLATSSVLLNTAFVDNHPLFLAIESHFALAPEGTNNERFQAILASAGNVQVFNAACMAAFAAHPAAAVVDLQAQVQLAVQQAMQAAAIGDVQAQVQLAVQQAMQAQQGGAGNNAIDDAVNNAVVPGQSELNTCFATQLNAQQVAKLRTVSPDMNTGLFLQIISVNPETEITAKKANQQLVKAALDIRRCAADVSKVISPDSEVAELDGVTLHLFLKGAVPLHNLVLRIKKNVTGSVYAIRNYQKSIGYAINIFQWLKMDHVVSYLVKLLEYISVMDDSYELVMPKLLEDNISRYVKEDLRTIMDFTCHPKIVDDGEGYALDDGQWLTNANSLAAEAVGSKAVTNKRRNEEAKEDAASIASLTAEVKALSATVKSAGSKTTEPKKWGRAEPSRDESRYPVRTAEHLVPSCFGGVNAEGKRIITDRQFGVFATIRVSNPSANEMNADGSPKLLCRYYSQLGMCPSRATCKHVHREMTVDELKSTTVSKQKVINDLRVSRGFRSVM
jgi:hypothetical protein